MPNRLRRKFSSGPGAGLTYRRRLAGTGGVGGDGTPWSRVTHRHLPSHLAIAVSYPPWEGARYLGPLAPRRYSVAGVGRDCRKLPIIMSTKTNKTPSTSRQTKRSCPGTDDSDTDQDSLINFPRWLIIVRPQLCPSLGRGPGP